MPVVVALLVIAAYAVLLPAGRWQADEYILSWDVAQQGWAALLDRVEGWSPRPIGEFVSFLYFLVSNSFHRPLIGYFLGFLWVTSLAGVVMAARVGQVRRPVFLAVLLFALSLLLAKPGQMYYWPMGASAYLPAWAGLGAATVLHRTALLHHRVALMLALLAAAFSVEIGAITVLIYSALVLLASVRDRALLRHAVPLILPALGALLVCLIVLHHRMQANEVFDAASGLAHNWPASLRAAVPTFIREAMGIAGTSLLVGCVIKVLLIFAIPPGDAGTKRDDRLGIVWCCSLLTAAFASVVLAYHQFGMLCCERHSTFRQAMILLAIATFAGLRGAPAPRYGLLAILLLTLFGMRAAPLYADWSRLGTVVAARQRNWESAAKPSDSMTLLLAPDGHITNSDALTKGSFRMPSGTGMDNIPLFAWGIMTRFGKHALTIAPADK